MAEAPATDAGRLTIGVPKETAPGERRVAMIPDAVPKLIAAGARVIVQAGAGEGAFIADEAFTEAGATLVPDAATLNNQADVILKVQAPKIGGDANDEMSTYRPGTTLIAFLQPLVNHDLVNALAAGQITSFSMDSIPRTTRAQSIDALSSMSTISGYKAAVLAADHLGKLMPLLMTAAGTIAPAKALIVGAGVAGLQAIATARRLGAVVEAYDTRPVVKEQVESLGAKFVDIDTGATDTQDAGGYAKEASADVIQRQQQVLADHAAKSDIVITTALVPGKPAPKLISEETVQAMRPGSVIVDLASEMGGNCELTVPGETVIRYGVTIIGLINLPSSLPVHASQMYSRNVQNLLALMLKDGRLDPLVDDDIVRGTCITHGGEVVHAATRSTMGLPSREEAAAVTSEPGPSENPEAESES
ncbi:MAG: Re/Si-specific NAD(P)(+) transhydrogenase subunit alpha, partial [Chloroflexota bacterium]|nr:Re/Si-specific NAD(P)(+) transhydrogenase subunit alpha [Chloroflexota bacterium]